MANCFVTDLGLTPAAKICPHQPQAVTKVRRFRRMSSCSSFVLCTSRFQVPHGMRTYSRITAQIIFLGCSGTVCAKTVPLCFAVAVAYNNQIPCDCCADVTFFMVVGRRIMACTHLWKCLLNFVLRLFQVAPGCFYVSSSLFHSISGRPAAPRTGFYPRARALTIASTSRAA